MLYVVVFPFLSVMVSVSDVILLCPLKVRWICFLFCRGKLLISYRFFLTMQPVVVMVK